MQFLYLFLLGSWKATLVVVCVLFFGNLSLWGLWALKIIGFYKVNFSLTFPPKVQYRPLFQTNKLWGCGTIERALNWLSGDQVSSLSFGPNKLCGIGPVLNFQIATRSRKTWVRVAFDIGHDPQFAKISIGSGYASKRERTNRKLIRKALQIDIISKESKWWREKYPFIFFILTKESLLIISPSSVYKGNLKIWVNKSKWFKASILLSLKLQQYQMIL